MTSLDRPTPTDDRGVYRIFGLPPGDYVVMAAAPRLPESTRNDPGLLKLSAADVDRALAQPGTATYGPAPAANATPGVPTTWAPVYYPGTSDVAAATQLSIGVGEEQAGINFTLRPQRAATISGLVTGPDGANVQSVVISISPSTDNARAGVTLGLVLSAQPGADGRYVLRNVAPGSYTLIARTGGGGRGLVAPNAPFLWANVDVTVDGPDLDVPIAVRGPIPVSGRVQVKLGAPGPPPDLKGYRFLLRPANDDPNLTNAPTTQPDDAGTLAFTNVAAGAYRFFWNAPGSGPALSLLSATVRGREILDGTLDIRAGAPIDDLVITMTDRPAEVTGSLQDASGRPATDYFIVVFPTDRTFWTPLSRRVMQTRPALDGSYRMRGLPAGEYYLAALTDIGNGETNDPKLLESLVPTASKIVVVEGKTTTQAFQIR